MKLHSILLSLFTSLLGAAEYADVIYHNAKVVTVDADFRIVNGLAVRGSRILAADTMDKLKPLAGPNTRLVDLEGRTVIPGLIDNHLHFIRDALRWQHQTRLDGITSRKEALAAISTKAAASAPGDWVFVLGGWSEDQFADQAGGFSREELDAAAPKNPVFIQKSYMATYMNSLAEQQLGSETTTSQTSVRSGGMMKGKGKGMRKGGGGGDSGARSTINAALNRYLPEPSKSQALQGIKDFSQHLNRLGLTTVYDVGRETDGPVEYCAELAQAQQATLRVFHTLRYTANDATEASTAAATIQQTKPLQCTDWTGLIGIGEHTYGPIHDSTMRFTRYTAEELQPFELIATAAAAGGWHIHDHAMQDSTITAYMDTFERIQKQHPTPRWTLAHCDNISPSSIARAKTLGLTLAIHNKTAKPAGREADSPPIRAIQESGIIWGLGSDGGVVAPLNPFLTLWWVVTGKILPNQQALQGTVSREQALIAHTRSNAYLLFKEKDLGSLEVGKLADFLVLDKDYLSLPADQLRYLRPVLTVVGGKTVYSSH
jgi:predicted amidohydrolase YtcJ